MAGQGVVGYYKDGSQVIPTDRIDLHIDDVIDYLNVDKSMLLHLMSKIGKETVTEMEHKWWTQERKKDTVAATAAGGNWAAGAADDGTITVAAADAHLFSEGDIFQIPAKSRTVMCYVDSVVLATGVITAKTVDQTTPDTLDLSGGFTDNLFLVSNSFESGGNRGTIKWESPTQLSNYVQIVQTPMGITTTAKHIKYRGVDEWTKLQFELGVDHAFKMEKNLFYGQKHYIDTGYQDGVYEQWFMGGLSDDAIGIQTNVEDLSAGALTRTAFNSWVIASTQYAKSPIIFSGELIYEALTAWAETKLELVRSEKTYGMAVTNWQTPYGTNVVLIPHRELLTGSDHTGEAFCLDMSDLKYRSLQGLDTHIVRNIETPGDKQTIDEIRTWMSMKIGNEKRHGWMYDVGSITT